MLFNELQILKLDSTSRLTASFSLSSRNMTKETEGFLASFIYFFYFYA